MCGTGLPILFAFPFHGKVSNEHRPHIGADLGDHQHPDYGHGVRPQHHRDVEAKEAQHNGQPHPAESTVPVFLRAAVEQYDNQKAQQGERDVAVDAPGEGRFGTEHLFWDIMHSAIRTPAGMYTAAVRQPRPLI